MWLNELSYDPIEPLISCKNRSIEYFTKRDLLDEDMPDISCLWELKAPKKIVRKQQDNGSWIYHGGLKELRSPDDYNQLETFRQLGELIEKYGFNNEHPTILKAVNYLFNCQTNEGDFRGIYGHQYATTYSAAIMELLIKSGYNNDQRIEKGFQWLLSHRQNDGGWAIPFRTLNLNYHDALKCFKPLQSDQTKPFSHLITGMVLRTFAAHPIYRNAPEGQQAGKLLMSRFFQRDKYIDRQDKKYWERVSFPFWFTDIVSSLDSLFFLGFKKEELAIQSALDHLINKQQSNGLFNLKLLRGKDKDLKYWISMVICRIIRRYYSIY
jgi:Squalene-hopene cyclase C-terminal domain